MGEKKPYSKAEFAALRRLVEKAYEAELGEALGDVEAVFKAWRRGEVFAPEVSDAIHEFHQHEARQLYSHYRDLPVDLLVCSAVARGYLNSADVPEALRIKLARLPSWPQ